jgi:putative tryptophan/tyrosine transport system substrate-binding protein
MRLIGLALCSPSRSHGHSDWRLAFAAFLGLILCVPSANAQNSASRPWIVILETGSESTRPAWMSSFKQELAQLGWIEGRNVRVDTRYADNQVDRMADLARQVVSLKPDLIFTYGQAAMIRAVTESTATIPIVVGSSGDLVGDGFAKSLARPGGNVTGMTLLFGDLELKRLEILKEAVPKVQRVAVLVTATTTSRYVEILREGARRLDIKLQFARVSTPGEVPQAFGEMRKGGVDALLVQDGPMLASSAYDIAALARTFRLPSISQVPRFAESGGLMQYGADILDVFRRSAWHVDKVLRGAKPGDVPIEQPTKFELVINLKTAKALGLTIPQSLLVRADELIQ